MNEITDKSPVLILPHEDLKRSEGMDHDHGVVQGVARQGFEVADSFGREEAWTVLASRYGELLREFMMRPYDASVLEAMHAVVRAGAAAGAAVSGGEAASLQGKEGWVDVSTTDPALLLSSLSGRGRSPRFRIMYDSGSNAYRVFWNRSPEAGDDVSDLMEHGAWILSSLNGAERGVRRILGDKALVDSVLEGARILYVPQDAGLAFPRLLAIARSRESGAGIHEFWMPRLGQMRGRGNPPIAYRVTDTWHEMLNVKDLIIAVERMIAKARAMGKRPVAVWDLDGTVLDAREFAARIFNEWLLFYDGPDAAEIREKAKRSNVERGWNSRTILRDMGVAREETLKDADAYFQANFYSAERRLEMLPIRGMVELVKLFMGMGVMNLYATLRSSSDDTLLDGGSSSERILKKYDIWEKDSVLLRHEGEKIDWSEAAYLAGGNEPHKWTMVKSFRKRNPGAYIVVVGDNAPAHNNGYREYFEYSVVNIHPRGDDPPNSPPLYEDGVFEVDPDRLALDLAGWMEGCVRKGRVLAAEVSRQFGKMESAESSPFFMSYPEKHEAEIRASAVIASRTIDAVAGINPLNAIYYTFLEEINRGYSASPGRLEIFEEMVSKVNFVAGTSYAVMRGPGGVERIVNAKRGRLPEDVVVRPAPISFDGSWMSFRNAKSIRELESVLPDLPAGPDLTGVIAGDVYDLLSFGEFPRMIVALKSAAEFVSRKRKRAADELRAMEYGPRLAVGAMLALARMGMKVGWRDPNGLKRIQTSYELMRAPEHLRSKIKYVPTREKVRADIALWNLPHFGTTLKTMTKGVKRDGIVLIQSQKSAAEYEKEGLGHRLMAEVALPTGQYVLPTAFLHVAPQFNMPLSFQAWRVR